MWYLRDPSPSLNAFHHLHFEWLPWLKWSSCVQKPRFFIPLHPRIYFCCFVHFASFSLLCIFLLWPSGFNFYIFYQFVFLYFLYFICSFCVCVSSGCTFYLGGGSQTSKCGYIKTDMRNKIQILVIAAVSFQKIKWCFFPNRLTMKFCKQCIFRSFASQSHHHNKVPPPPCISGCICIYRGHDISRYIPIFPDIFPILPNISRYFPIFPDI